MKRKSILIILWMVFCAIPSHAVLKEKDISSTLSILRTELTNYHMELERQSGMMQAQQERVRTNIMQVLNQSNQNSLMLYSQKEDYIFDLTYACHEATEQYQRFQSQVMPFNEYIQKNRTELARYDSLIQNLSMMLPQMLPAKAQVDRNVCLTLAINIYHTLKQNNEQMAEYITYYRMASNHLKELNDYANKRYSEIQNSIFKNGGDNYFKILSQLRSNLQQTEETVASKYKPKGRVMSQWDSRMILVLFGSILVYGIIAVLLNLLVIRIIVSKLIRLDRFKSREKSFLAKRTCIIMATTVVTFAVILGTLSFTVNQNFFIMASGLLMEYTWLLGVILISLLLRLDASQIKSAFRIYSPLMVVGFIVISFRIILIPNDLVNMIFPPVLLLCSIWQWRVIKRHGGNIPKSDVFYTYMSLFVFVASVICSWIGYTLLSVQLLIWWIMQLTCILTITCVSGWLRQFAEKRKLDDHPITERWFFNLVKNVMLPVLGVLSVLLSIYWAADVFNLSDTTKMVFRQRFINSTNFQLSIFNICQVVILYFIFQYLNKTIKEFVRYHLDKADRRTAASRNTMAKNVIQIIVWGFWLIICLSICHVSNTWLVVISGGLSTGVGFASKDILENIYYGISLMTGRVKVGDYIECDGTRGRVSSISYTSTMLDTIDGSVIAFQNSQLFTKNYKNLTRNHGYELAIIPVGIAYGSNIKEVKEMLIDAINQLDCRDKKKEVKVILSNFGDNSVDLKVLVWVPVLTHAYAEGDIKEVIYDTLNAHHIEIPFPQRDLHIIPTDPSTAGNSLPLSDDAKLTEEEKTALRKG